MTPTQYLRAFVRWWWIIAICTVAGTGITLLAGAAAGASYTSTSSVLLSPTTTGQTTSSDAYTGSLLAKQRITSYADIARSKSLAADVVDQLDLELTAGELEDRIDVSNPTDTTLLNISVRDADRDQARLIAAQAAESMVEVVDQLEAVRGKGRPLLRAAVVGESQPPVVSTEPPVWRNPVLGAAGGLVLGLGLAVVAARLDRRLREESDVSDALGSPVLGVLPSPPGVGRASAERNDGTAWDDAVRELRTSLFFTHPGPDGCLSVTITSPHHLRGVPEIAFAVATALSDTGARVLLVEGDLREPRLASMLGLDDAGSAGLSSYLAGSSTGQQVVQRHSSGVHVIPAGATPASPADLLHSQVLTEVLEDAAKRYDFVLVTAPPTSVGTDAAAVAARCDGALLTVLRGRTTQPQLLSARRQLERVDASVLGAVLVS